MCSSTHPFYSTCYSSKLVLYDLAVPFRISYLQISISLGDSFFLKLPSQIPRKFFTDSLEKIILHDLFCLAGCLKKQWANLAK